MSAFTDALRNFVEAANNHIWAVTEPNDAAEVEAADRDLAQAGDVLERELVALIRKHGGVKASDFFE